MTHELVPLPWDSEFFGFSVGRFASADTSPATVARVLAQARDCGLRLLYWCTPPDAPPDALRAAGVCLMDRKVTYVASARCGNSHPSIHSTHSRTDQLFSLALQSGQYSRFRLDTRMPPASFERLYATWLDRSLSGEIAREVMVYKQEQRELGFLTLCVKNARPDIGLFAVDSSGRGRGVGTALVGAAVARAAEWGYAAIQVVTQQDNEPACNLYEKCGFSVDSVEHIHHAWL